jgi:phosphoadenosine phosphosulfate reductase
LHRKVFARQYKRAVNDAHAIIEAALARIGGNGRVAVGVSGGKDSVAMCHIVAQHCRPVIIYNDSGLEMPESIDVVRALAQQLGLELHIAKGDAISLELAGKNSDMAIVKPIQQAHKDLGIELEFVGLRMSESKRRRMVIGAMGPIYQSRRWGCLVAWPMRYWTAADVFAYLDEYSLPVHPAYYRQWDGDRDNIRVSWVYDSDRDRLGAVEYVRRYYPSLYNKLSVLGVIQ